MVELSNLLPLAVYIWHSKYYNLHIYLLEIANVDAKIDNVAVSLAWNEGKCGVAYHNLLNILNMLTVEKRMASA